MEEIAGFSPNWATHSAFGDALQQACEGGVIPLAYSAVVTPNQVVIDKPVFVDLEKGKNNVAK